jgi:hypothetical protein
LDLKQRLKKHELMATLKPNKHKVYIGDRGEVGGRSGTVMFVGPAEFAGGGVVVGLRLDEKRTTSECDGKYDGERLFRCKPGFGIFVPVEDVTKVDDAADDDDDAPGPAGGNSGGVNGESASSSLDPVNALERVVGKQEAKRKIQAMVNALQVNRRRVAAGGRAEPAPHVVLTVSISHPPHSASLIAHTRLTFIFLQSGRARGWQINARQDGGAHRERVRREQARPACPAESR